MSKQNSETQSEVRTTTGSPDATVPAGTVETPAIPFNPFTLLSADENAALITRLNPQWKTEHDGDIRLTATEHKCSNPEATVYVWLKNLATDQIETQAYNRIFASNKAMLEQIAAGSKASLAILAEDYQTIPDSMLRKYRINLRDAITSKWIGETAARILEKIMDATGVKPESQWMR